MTAKLLRGKECAENIKTEIKEAIQKRLKNNLNPPGLAVILVGNDPASEVYVSHKQKACQAVGIHSEIHRLSSDCSQKDIEKKIEALNQNPHIHGILLQLPLPAPLHADDLLEHIHPQKDVDGFHPYNMGRLAERRPLLRPCTPYGVMELL